MADVESKELMILAEKAPERGEKYNRDGYKLRVVLWFGTSKKGKAWQSAKLERRKFYLDGDEQKIGKAEGLTLDDLRALKERWKEVIALMQNPPKIEEQKPDAGGEDLSEVPF